MKRWMKISAAIVAILGAGALGVCWHMGKFDDNFREVTPDKYYRSAQMDEAGLRRAVERHKIKSVLNLRGEAPRESWYQSESRVCRDLGMAHHNVELSGVRLPEPSDVRLLIEALDKGPYPMLVHCLAGSDRTGLASAMYLILIEKRPVKEAVDAQLTWHYGHVPLGGSASMDRFFDLYLKHGGGKEFRFWALEDYPALYKKSD